MQKLKIGTSWVRGVVGDALTPELIVDFACAFGTWADAGLVVIGCDPRRSSVMLRSAVLSGLLSPGCEVIDLGVCPTPLVSFAVRELGAAGGISITGSHNDAEWNALKFVGPDGALLNAVRSEEMLDIYHASAFHAASELRANAIQSAPDLVDRYVEHLCSALDVAAIRGRKFKVAVDFCNGSCEPVLARFLGELGCTLVALNRDRSGRFAHPPSPSADNMRDLATLLRQESFDLGAAVNVDGDRVAFTLPNGHALSEEHTLPLAAENRLRRRPGSIVTNYSTSRMVDVVAERHGQQVVRTAVGEGHVMDRGLEEDAVLAGEGSGGVGALPTTMTFDAALTLGMILEMQATTDTPLDAELSALPSFTMCKGVIPCAADQVYRALERFRAAFPERDRRVTDGMYVSWGDAWMHVRASNTEPLLRVIVEAENEAHAHELFEASMQRGRKAMVHRRGNA